ncbi:MAG: ComEC/Rec2 family competence protein [Planctomycetota bacterium]
MTSGTIQVWLHRQPLVALASAACVGILSNQFFDPSDWTWPIALAGSSLWTWSGPKRTRMAAVLLVIVSAYAWRHQGFIRKHERVSLLAHVDTVQRPAIARGIIDRIPTFHRIGDPSSSRRRHVTDIQTRFEVRLTACRLDAGFERVDGRLLVSVDEPVDELGIGDQVELFGRWQRFEGPGNPGERDFRDTYLQRRLHARMRIDDSDGVVIHGRGKGWSYQPWRWANRMADFGRNSLLRHTDDSTGPLALALVLGQKEFVPASVRDLLLITGTAHLLSVSGLHLAIVVMMANGLAILLDCNTICRVGLVMAVCVAYTAVTGGRPPVIRASILVATLALGWVTLRPVIPLNSLGWAALLILYWNPTLLNAVGVQLSFLAVTTLIIAGDRSITSSLSVNTEIELEDHQRRSATVKERLQTLVDQNRPNRMMWLKQVRIKTQQALRYSSVVSLISAPLIWFQFQVVAPISVLANVVLGPLMMVALSTGLLTILADGVSQKLGTIPGWICHATLWMMRVIIDWAARLPGGHWWLPPPPGVAVLFFYAMVVVWLLHRSHLRIQQGKYFMRVRRGTNRTANTRTRVRLASSMSLFIGCAAWFITTSWLATSHRPLDQDAMEAIFVDVGHGTSVVLRFSDEETWLYDCGHLGNDSGACHGIEDVLWSLGVTRLQGIILSHADADHFNALPGLLERFTVQRIVTPPGLLDESESSLQPIRDAIERHHIPVLTWSNISKLKTTVEGRFGISVLHPGRIRLQGSDNANSLVLGIQSESSNLILPGDLEPPGTNQLINGPRPKPGGVVMAPHHGSLTADAEAVLWWSRPSIVVVSGGSRSGRLEVRQMLAATGAEVVVTESDGAIRIQLPVNGRPRRSRWRWEPW